MSCRVGTRVSHYNAVEPLSTSHRFHVSKAQKYAYSLSYIITISAMINDFKLQIITYLRILICILFINTDACKMSTITMLACSPLLCLGLRL